MNRDQVILVNEKDEQTGVSAKLEAHLNGGLRHRAFSIFILNADNQLLLQKRSCSKYHAAGLWANSCCSHPQPGDNLIQSAQRRLQEELGFTTALTYLDRTEYKTAIDNQLSEWEIDHLLIGFHDKDDIINPNSDEVSALRWIDLDALNNELSNSPAAFAPWLPLILPTFLQHHES